jgi:hypothetical protein
MIISNGSGYILKGNGSYCNILEVQRGQRGSAGGVHGSGTGAEWEGRQTCTGGEWSGGRRSGVSEGTPQD